MTFVQMLDDVKARCAITDSNLDGQIRQWLNLAQQNIITRYTWQFLFQEDSISTVAAQDTYSLGTDVMHIYMLRDTTNNRRISYATNLDFFKAVPNPVSTGAPYTFRIIGSRQAAVNTVASIQVVLYPIPDAVYTVYYSYYMRVNDLSASSDISLIPVQFHELLVHYACKAYYSREGDPRAVSHQDEFESMLKNMVSQLAVTPVDRIDTLGRQGSNNTLFLPFPSHFGEMTDS